MQPFTRQFFYIIFMRIFKILLFIAFNLAVIELLMRLVNNFYPIEPPKKLGTVTAIHWLQGFDTYNGKTRLYHYQPNSIGITHGHPIKINNWGFRGADFEKRSALDSDLYRVMILGDSVVFGEGVSTADRFTEQASARLRDKRPDTRFELINLGVEGFETLQELKIMKVLGEVISPNLVVVGFSTNDPNISYKHYEPIKFPLNGIVSKLRDHLLTVRILEKMYDPIVRKVAGIPTHDEEVQAAYNPTSENWNIFTVAVRDIAAWSMENTGQPPVVILLEDPAQSKKKGRYEAAKRAFIENGFAWLEPPAGCYRAVSRFDPHPSPFTHQVFADVLSAYLADKTPAPSQKSK